MTGMINCSSFSLSSLCDYPYDIPDAAHARAISKELKYCPQLERFT